jgi:hypothetical protein
MSTDQKTQLPYPPAARRSSDGTQLKKRTSIPVRPAITFDRIIKLFMIGISRLSYGKRVLLLQSVTGITSATRSHALGL